jgi:hypothetical protein
MDSVRIGKWSLIDLVAVILMVVIMIVMLVVPSQLFFGGSVAAFQEWSHRHLWFWLGIGLGGGVVTSIAKRLRRARSRPPDESPNASTAPLAETTGSRSVDVALRVLEVAGVLLVLVGVWLLLAGGATA